MRLAEPQLATDRPRRAPRNATRGQCFSVGAAAALAAPTNHFNVKFTFTGQTSPDGTVGEIQAGSKLTGPNRNQLTVCDYSTTGGVTHLGQFESSSFSSQDPDPVLQFCLDNYVNRTL